MRASRPRPRRSVTTIASWHGQRPLQTQDSQLAAVHSLDPYALLLYDAHPISVNELSAAPKLLLQPLIVRFLWGLRT